MGLDATVYCNCFETGKLKTPPRPEWKVYVQEDGCRTTGADDLNTKMAFDRWSDRTRACIHEGGELIHHRIGNLAAVLHLNAELWKHARRLQDENMFPIILDKVLYSSCHCGDFLDLATVRELHAELETLADVHAGLSDAEHWFIRSLAGSTEEAEYALRTFEAEMTELVECALRVGKPISF